MGIFRFQHNIKISGWGSRKIVLLEVLPFGRWCETRAFWKGLFMFVDWREMHTTHRTQPPQWNTVVGVSYCGEIRAGNLLKVGGIKKREWWEKTLKDSQSGSVSTLRLPKWWRYNNPLPSWWRTACRRTKWTLLTCFNKVLNWMFGRAVLKSV